MVAAYFYVILIGLGMWDVMGCVSVCFGAFTQGIMVVSIFVNIVLGFITLRSMYN